MNCASKRLAELQTAFMLLTRIPVGNLTARMPNLADALWAFPIVGFFVGGIIAGCYLLMSQIILSSVTAAIFALTAGLLCTGAIHEDGLADCADGFGGGQNKEKKLAIMRDSAIGTFGTLALILVMGFRIFILSSLPAMLEIVLLIVICAVISRFVMVGYLYFLPAVRKEGLGSQASINNMFSLFSASVVVSPALIIGSFVSYNVIIAILVVAILWGIFAKYQVGGQTGDICGAGQILCETAGWVVLLLSHESL